MTQTFTGISSPASGGVPSASSVRRDLCPTLLPLDRFARVIGYSPMLMHQVYVDTIQPVTGCSDPILQYTWQPASGGNPSRHEISEAICKAEADLEQHLHFSLKPRWYADEYVTPYRAMPLGNLWLFQPYYFKVLSGMKHVIQGGVEAWSVVQAGAAVVYSDNDGDGYAELATVVVTTTVTDDDEIAVYYPGTSHDPGWEIRPISVTISGGSATIKFQRYLAVMPNLQEALGAVAVDGLVDANFLATVDVFRHYNDPSTMAVVEWSPGICDENECIVDAQTACFTQVDGRNGVLSIHAADWDADTSTWEHVCPTWWQHPSRVRLNHRSGYRDTSRARPMHEMLAQFERAVAYLAITNLDREWTTCEPMRNLQAHWKTDLALRESKPAQSISYNVSRELLNNPLGTTRAAMFAWGVVQRYAVGEAVTGV